MRREELSLKPPFLKAALDATRAKFRVFPVAPTSKVPAIKDWQANATSNAKTVKRLWRLHPNANIGIVTGGQAGLFVLDVEGEKGRDSLQALKQKFGPLPRTVVTRTPHGRHYYFRGAEPLRNNSKKLRPGLDGRGEGGYVVGAGSINDQGARYRYLNGHSPEDVDIAEIPACAARQRSLRPSSIPNYHERPMQYPNVVRRCGVTARSRSCAWSAGRHAKRPPQSCCVRDGAVGRCRGNWHCSGQGCFDLRGTRCRARSC
jgi:hypothetical protein